jgi:type IV secretory pathway TrbL component
MESRLTSHPNPAAKKYEGGRASPAASEPIARAMTQNPNAFAAAFAAGAAIVAQWLVQRYAHASLSDYWKAIITAGASTAALYIGREGLRNALARILSGPKTVWSGSTTPPATPGSPASSASPAPPVTSTQ